MLDALGATDQHGLTALGRELSRLPLHPRIGAMLLAGARLGAAEGTAIGAALLSERDIVRYRADAEASGVSSSDLLDRIRAVDKGAVETGPRYRRGEVNEGAVRRVRAASKQLLRLLAPDLRKNESADDRDIAVRKAALAGFADRLARRRSTGSDRAVMVGGLGVKLDASSRVREDELFVALAMVSGRRGERSEGRVRIASAVQRKWIRDRIRAESGVEFDTDGKRIIGVTRQRFRDLVLREKQGRIEDKAKAAELLALHAADDIDAALDINDEVCALVARIDFLRVVRADLELPAIDDSFFRSLLPTICAGHTSFAQLKKVKLVDHIRGALGWERSQQLDSLAPERVTVPSGSRIRLRYGEGDRPILPVRIQEMYSAKETPRIAGGRVPVLLHLLAPNMRPQQVTDDLASFWQNAYPEVRKELRRRYAKHDWPDDPANAKPSKRPRRKKKPEK